MRPLEAIINALEADVLEGLTGHLLTIVNSARAARIDSVLDSRTRYLTVVLENIYQTHNASAVVRSCECLGVQDIHAIESSNPFQPNKSIVQGAAKWLTLHRYRGDDSTTRCLESLKNAGYTIAAMSPEPDGLPVGELSVDAPLALCFGSEEPGLSAEARQLADVATWIPMHGFTQSLNLSVSAGIALAQLSARLYAGRAPWQLPEADRRRLRALWLARSIPAGRRIVERYITGASG